MNHARNYSDALERLKGERITVDDVASMVNEAEAIVEPLYDIAEGRTRDFVDHTCEPNISHDRFAMDRLPGMGDDWIKDRFLDPAKMAESKATVHDRMEAYWDGYRTGRQVGTLAGVAWGVSAAVVVVLVVAILRRVIG